MADTYNIDSEEAFGIQTDDDIDRLMNSYTDEDFIQYIRLNNDYDRTELLGKIAMITSSIRNKPNAEIIIKLFRKIYQRLLDRLEKEEDDDSTDEEETTITVPKAPKVIKKRHTLVVNSSKRINRNQSTTSFSWQLDQEIANVKSLSIESYNIPKNWYNIDNSISNNVFAIEYVQPMKIRFEKDPDTIEDAFHQKAPIHGNSGLITATDTEIKNWFNENIVNDDIGSGMIRDAYGNTLTDFPTRWVDAEWQISSSGPGKEDFTLSNYNSATNGYLDISYLVIPNGTFNFIVVRDKGGSSGTDGITTTNVRENGDKNIYFIIKRDMIDDIFTSLPYNYKGTSCNNIGEVIAAFLNSRQPKDYNGENEDPRGNAHKPNKPTQSYDDLLKQIDNEGKYVPPNTKKASDYDLWSSFKYVDFNGGAEFKITTNLIKKEAYDLMKDLKNIDISWNIETVGISSQLVLEPEENDHYDITGQKVDSSSIELTFIPKNAAKQIKRKVYFRMPSGHYGTVSKLLTQLNGMAPKKYYDRWLSSDISGAEDMNNIIINTWVDVSDSTIPYTDTTRINTKKAHDLVRDAYDNDIGTSFFNTIDWSFSRATNQPVKLDSITPDISFIFFDSSFKGILNGDSGCIGRRRSDGGDGFFDKTTTLGKHLGYYTDDDPNSFILTSNNLTGVIINSIDRSISLPPTEQPEPDLRLINYVNIVFVDYKNSAFLVNANQNRPAGAEGDPIATPKYMSEVEFEKVCDEDGVENMIPVYTNRNTRVLTENQIYSLNSILSTQQTQLKATSNYLYQDYILYGIGVREKPEMGNSSNDGVLQTYDSKKGKREYIQPTRLTKFHIELVDQNFNLINLNGIDIEFTFNIDTETKVDT